MKRLAVVLLAFCLGGCTFVQPWTNSPVQPAANQTQKDWKIVKGDSDGISLVQWSAVITNIADHSRSVVIEAVAVDKNGAEFASMGLPSMNFVGGGCIREVGGAFDIATDEKAEIADVKVLTIWSDNLSPEISGAR